jgi:hypothetical protein
MSPPSVPLVHMSLWRQSQTGSLHVTSRFSLLDPVSYRENRCNSTSKDSTSMYKNGQDWRIHTLHCTAMWCRDNPQCGVSVIQHRGLRWSHQQELQPVEVIFNCFRPNSSSDVPESSAVACPSCAWSCTIPHESTYVFADVGKTPSGRSWSHYHRQTAVCKIMHSLWAVLRLRRCKSFYMPALFAWWYKEQTETQPHSLCHSSPQITALEHIKIKNGKTYPKCTLRIYVPLLP